MSGLTEAMIMWWEFGDERNLKKLPSVGKVVYIRPEETCEIFNHIYPQVETVLTRCESSWEGLWMLPEDLKKNSKNRNSIKPLSHLGFRRWVQCFIQMVLTPWPLCLAYGILHASTWSRVADVGPIFWKHVDQEDCEGKKQNKKTLKGNETPRKRHLDVWPPNCRQNVSLSIALVHFITIKLKMCPSLYHFKS